MDRQKQSKRVEEFYGSEEEFSSGGFPRLSSTKETVTVSPLTHNGQWSGLVGYASDAADSDVTVEDDTVDVGGSGISAEPRVFAKDNKDNNKKYRAEMARQAADKREAAAAVARKAAAEKEAAAASAAMLAEERELREAEEIVNTRRKLLVERMAAATAAVIAAEKETNASLADALVEQSFGISNREVWYPRQF